MLKYIMHHNNLSGNFKLLSKYSSKMCKFKIKSFDSMEKSYKSAGLMHDKQQFKHNVELVIASTPNTTTSTESTEYIHKFQHKIMNDQAYERNYATLFFI